MLKELVENQTYGRNDRVGLLEVFMSRFCVLQNWICSDDCVTIDNSAISKTGLFFIFEEIRADIEFLCDVDSDTADFGLKSLSYDVIKSQEEAIKGLTESNKSLIEEVSILKEIVKNYETDTLELSKD